MTLPRPKPVQTPPTPTPFCPWEGHPEALEAPLRAPRLRPPGQPSPASHLAQASVFLGTWCSLACAFLTSPRGTAAVGPTAPWGMQARGLYCLHCASTFPASSSPGAPVHSRRSFKAAGSAQSPTFTQSCQAGPTYTQWSRSPVVHRHGQGLRLFPTEHCPKISSGHCLCHPPVHLIEWTVSHRAIPKRRGAW